MGKKVRMGARNFSPTPVWLRELMRGEGGSVVPRPESEWEGLPVREALTDYAVLTGMENYRKIVDEIEGSPRVRIRDERKYHPLTGEELMDTGRMHANPPEKLVESIAKAAVKNGEDPYTWLAMGLQETNLDWDEWSVNLFHTVDPKDKGSFERFGGAKKPGAEVLFQPVFDFWKEKKRIAESLGKKGEEELIQAWNGYGVVTPESNEYGTDTLYGVKLPVDFGKDPLYGKVVADLKRNVIMKSDAVRRIVERVKGQGR